MEPWCIHMIVITLMLFLFLLWRNNSIAQLNVAKFKTDNYLSIKTTGHYSANPMNTSKALKAKQGLTSAA